jgi:CDP-paratose 2-epimerase
MKRALVTGSSGLVGSEMVKKLCQEEGWQINGVDNNLRGYLFGEDSFTDSERLKLRQNCSSFHPLQVDIRDYEKLKQVFQYYGPFDFICHAAAQPAHEWATNNALEDFAINATGTMNVLEAYRQYSSGAVFVHVSSSKVYGDSVNELPLIELETRYDLPEDHLDWEGVQENFGQLDGNLHSLFGASKACADIMAKEYATYFNLPISIFRPVCISGSAHKGAPLHGYLAYLVKCVATGTKYTINGYKGKQLRDNIHAADLVNAFWEAYLSPPPPGTAFNLGAGRESCNSILEALSQAGRILGKEPIYDYVDKTRRGDHMWCIYNSHKFKQRYPEWKIRYDNAKLMEEICSQYL